ncbi:flavodoxin family protein [Desulfonema ishimotonii]|uniref:Flavodoxin family protein n=1 Tax=Desulfonema ishimotonii TaxID=45657 RepID=A0A401FUE2_9BACT|nr:flavodoxin family protein [Desulfonema ishimotonii]GBC60586.1 flavodoxin family protein [Desulfonema ishimotonii]
MNIVCLNGSPRLKGNSATISAKICETAEQKGAAVSTWNLNKLDFRGCQACYACKTKSDTCVLKDDLAEVLEAVRTADMLILATPVYYGDVSSQMKAFIDRTFSFLVPDFKNAPSPNRLEGDKKLLFVITQGNPDETVFQDIYPRYSTLFKWNGFGQSELIRACGLANAGDAAEREDVMNQVEVLARKLFG